MVFKYYILQAIRHTSKILMLVIFFICKMHRIIGCKMVGYI